MGTRDRIAEPRPVTDAAILALDPVSTPVLDVPVLHVCVTCRANRPPGLQAPPGRQMFDAVASHPAAGRVELREVSCLSSCDYGCAAAISMPGKWTYLLGRLDPSLAGDLLEYAATYAAHPSGTVLPSKRPASLAKMILGRLPA
jgi:predicted metal-binding protein